MIQVFFLLFGVLIATAPWEYDPSEREAIQQQIDEKHRERSKRYFADSYFTYFNFSDKDCLFCQIEDGGNDLEERLRQGGFSKQTFVSRCPGHCMGINLLFIEYLLSDPPIQTETCEEIFLRFQNSTFSKQKAHHLQVNQPGYYRNFIENKSVLGDPPSAKAAFEILVGSPPEAYYHIPLQERQEARFHRVLFYQALKALQGQTILVALVDEEEKRPHCFVIYAEADKILTFDPNQGLREFVDFETLSYFYEKAFAKERFSFLLSFRNSKTSGCGGLKEAPQNVVQADRFADR